MHAWKGSLRLSHGEQTSRFVPCGGGLVALLSRHYSGRRDRPSAPDEASILARAAGSVEFPGAYSRRPIFQPAASFFSI
jgi:hypothetical protein